MELNINKKLDKIKSEDRIKYISEIEFNKKIPKYKEPNSNKLSKKLKTISFFLFKEYVDKGNNGVLGPDYHNYGYYKISFGKLSIILTIFIIIPLLIFLTLNL